MIFWIAPRDIKFLNRVACTDRICFTQNKSWRHQLKKTGGYGLLREVAVKKDNNIDFFDISHHKSQNRSVFRESLTVFTEKDDIDLMPDRVVVQTENIEFIRELFFRGKLVSWFDPHFNNAKYFTQFKFEYLFLHLGKHLKFIVHPDGVTHPIKDEYGNYKYNLNSWERRGSMKWQKKIGCRMNVVYDRLDKVGEYKYNFRKRMREGNLGSKGFMPKFGRFYNILYFNYLSITYMLWKQSTVTSVTKKGARRG